MRRIRGVIVASMFVLVALAPSTVAVHDATGIAGQTVFGPPVATFDLALCAGTHRVPGPGEPTAIIVDIDGDGSVCFTVRPSASDTESRNKFLICAEATDTFRDFRAYELVIDTVTRATKLADVPVTEVVGATPTRHTITLRVEDWCGGVVTVARTYDYRANAAPVAVISAASVEEDVDGNRVSPVDLDASASFDESATTSAPLTLTWLLRDVADSLSVVDCGSGVLVTGCIVPVGSYSIELTATDVANVRTTATQLLVARANTPPTASFVGLVEEDWNGSGRGAVTLDASASADSRSDGGPASGVSIVDWSWRVTAPGGAVSSCTSKIASCTTLPVGGNAVELTVTDNGGASAQVQRVVNVPANTPPTARIAAVSVEEAWAASGLGVIHLNGSTSSDSGHAMSAVTAWEWTLSRASDGVIAASCAGAVVACAVAPGTYDIALRVTDNGGASHDATFPSSVTVLANTPPSAAFAFTFEEDWDGDGFGALHLNGTASADNRADAGDPSTVDIVQWTWRVRRASDDAVAVTCSGEIVTCAVAPGVYRIELEVLDNGGASSTHRLPAIGDAPVTIAANTPPTAAMAAIVIAEEDWDGDGVTVATLDGRASTDSRSDGRGTESVSVANWTWSARRAGAEVATCYGANVSCALPTGTLDIVLTVRDNGGGTGTTSQTGLVVLANTPPQAAITSKRTVEEDWNGNGTARIRVDASDSRDRRSDGGSTSPSFFTLNNFAWTILDSTGVSKGSCQSTIPETDCWMPPGEFTLVLTVTDNGGASDTVQTDIEILPNTPPVPEITLVLSEEDWNGDGVIPLALDASGTFDQRLDGRPGYEIFITNYTWRVSRISDGELFKTCYGDIVICDVPLYSGPYNVTLAVTDNGGAVEEAWVFPVEVFPNQRPTASLDSVTLSGVGGRTIAVKGFAQDPRVKLYCSSLYLCDPPGTANAGSPPLTFIWDFGDGNSTSVFNRIRESVVTHTYAADGIYRVTLKSRDAGGLESTLQSTIVQVSTLFATDFSTLAPGVWSFDGLWHSSSTTCTTGIATGPSSASEPHAPFIAYNVEYAATARGEHLSAPAPSREVDQACTYSSKDILGADASHSGSAVFKFATRGWPGAVLDFRHRGGFDPNEDTLALTDSAVIEWSLDNATWLPTVGGRFDAANPLPSTWAAASVQIPLFEQAHANGPVWIRFRFFADAERNEGTGWLIDDVTVSGDHGKAIVVTTPNPGYDHDGDGKVTVTLDASRALFVAPDHVLAYRWLEAGTVLAIGERVAVPFSVGDHAITLEVDVQSPSGIVTARNALGVRVVANPIPIASFTRTCRGLVCTFDGSASVDPNGGAIVARTWTVTGGPLTAPVVTTGVNLAYTFPLPGIYTVTHRVADVVGAFNESSSTFSVHPWSDDVESDSRYLADWTRQGTGVNLWSRFPSDLCGVPARSGRFVLAFTQGALCTYDLARRVNGSIVGPIVDTTKLDVVEVRFASLWERESCQVVARCLGPVLNDTTTLPVPDSMTLQASMNGGASWSTIWALDPARNASVGWEQVSVDVTAMKSASFRLRFVFDSVDDQFNAYKGWFIDDVLLKWTNIAPVADLSATPKAFTTSAPDVLVPVTLDASRSHDEGVTLTYAWFVDGVQVATGEAPTVYLKAGTYSLALVVTDWAGVSDSDDAVLRVNLPPVSVAGSPILVHDFAVDGFARVPLDGSSSSDADGSIASYKWYVGRSLIAEGAVTSAILSAGSTTVYLNVTDNDGAESVSSVVARVNRVPVVQSTVSALVSDWDLSGSEPVFFDATGTVDPDGTISAYRWRAADGTLLATGQVTSASLPVGIHVITLNVTDDSGGSRESDHSVKVNRLPIADAGMDHVVHDRDDDGITSVILDGTASRDMDGTVANYTWLRAGVEVAWGAIANVTIPKDVHTFTLKVTDDDGAWATDTMLVRVNRAPIGVVTIPPVVHDLDRDGSETVPLHAAGSVDPDGAIVTYAWYVGTVNIANGAVTSAVLPVGAHDVVLHLTDDDGGTTTTLARVKVNARPNVFAVSDFPLHDTNGDLVEVARLNASSSWDGDGALVTYEWLRNDGTLAANGVIADIGLAVGTHLLRLRAVDDDGAANETTILVTVAPNTPPTINVKWTCEGLVCAFDARATTDPYGGTVDWYAWATSDGATDAANLPVPGVFNHTFLLPGVYEVEVTGRDNGGASSEARATFEVFPWSDDFEAPLRFSTKWLLGGAGTNLWQTIEASTCGVGALGSGRVLAFTDPTTCTYAIGGRAQGTATTPVLDTRNLDEVELRFETLWDREGCEALLRCTGLDLLNTTILKAPDTMRVDASQDGGATWTTLWAFDPETHANTSDGWESVAVDVTGLRSDAFLVRFTFDSGDDQFNAHRGWFIDDLRLKWTNHAPVADAAATVSPVHVLPTAVDGVVRLDGSLSTDAGNVLTYRWLEAGAPIATGVVADVTFSTGWHALVLEVTDWSGAKDTMSFSVLVNKRPVPVAGGETLVHDMDRDGSESVALDGSASADADGVLTKFEWFEGGALIATGIAPAVTLATGDHLITLRVTDDAGGVSDSSTAVRVNVPPRAKAGLDIVLHDDDRDGLELARLDAIASSDADGAIVAYEWWLDGALVSTARTFQIPVPLGTTEFLLKVSDNNTARDTDTVIVHVNDPPVPVITGASRVSDHDADGSENIVFNAASSTDSDGFITQYEWTKNGAIVGTGSSITLNFPVGDHEVGLRAMDDDGGRATVKLNVTVLANAPPTAAFVTSCLGFTCSFDARASSDPDGVLSAYEWDFGDGATATGSTATHRYAGATNADVRLVVRDNGASADTATRALAVTPAYATGFETGTLDGWELSPGGTNRWAVSTACDAGRGSFVLAFAAPNGVGGCEYGPGHVKGSVTSPTLNLSTLPTASLRFSNFFEVENWTASAVDLMKFFVSEDAGKTWIPLAQWDSTTHTSGGWREEAYDITSFNRNTLRIRLTFDSVDDFSNDHPGWYVDNFRIG